MKRASMFVSQSLSVRFRKHLADALLCFAPATYAARVGIGGETTSLACFRSLTPRAELNHAAIPAEGTE